MESNEEINVRKRIRVETFQFIDNLEHIISPESVLGDCKDDIEIVKKAFLNAGWEGDGDIGLIWIPPFVSMRGGINNEYVWHVKQSNNGISFLGFEETNYNVYSNNYENNPEYEAVTITSDDTSWCVERIQRYRDNLHELEVNKNKLSDEMYRMTLNAIHGGVVSDFIETIDEIYLDIILHVIDCDNKDKLKLSKSVVRLPLDEISKGTEEAYFDSWLLLRTIESSIWKDFKFWQVREKIKEISRAVDFVADEEVKRIILTHIEIRNAFQHHSGQFTSDMKRLIGAEKIEMLDESSNIKSFKLWNRIELSIPEVEKFCDNIESFINSYENHIETRMKSRNYKYNKGANTSSFKPLEIETDDDTLMPENGMSSDSNVDKRVIYKKEELISYIYYLQYVEEEDDITVETKEHSFVVYESSTFKVNYEESTAEEFYNLLKSISNTVTCNGVEFEYNGEKYMSKEEIPITETVISNIINVG